MSNSEEEVMPVSDEDSLSHYGILRRSGRYPYGSGGDPYQNATNFAAFMNDMKSKGLSTTEVAKYLSGDHPSEKISTTDLRSLIAVSTETIRAQNVAQALRLSDSGNSNVEIAKKMGTNESTVRGWLKKSQEDDQKSIRAVADNLKKEVDEKKYLDVGLGTELLMQIKVSKTKLTNALAMLREEGYKVHQIKIPTAIGDRTNTRVLTKDNVTTKEVYDNLGRLQNVKSYLDPNSGVYQQPDNTPVSVSSKRLQIRYDEDGGSKMDGVIELRPGVPELSMGENKYGQVRIAVDGSHYLKGMAIYANDLPPGIDMRFNTNKSVNDKKVIENGKLGALKELKTVDGQLDKAQPFGAQVVTRMYTDKDGKQKTSPLNMVNEAGDWDKWSKTLSSQFLSKQPVALAQKQLSVTQKKYKDDLAEINALTNPVVKKKLLEEYAGNADAAAVHLKAAAIDRQATKVILPMNSMRPGEIYAPGFENGDRVALVRYPHGGTFEIPDLVVNNNNRTAKVIMGGATDAVGIHHSVAQKLSGADFDGDTVLVIPNNNRAIKANPALSGPLSTLKDFDPKRSYPETPGMTYMTKKDTQKEMGKVSNLITDMTIAKAPDQHIAAAVKHSMVVIDAEKHKLNYKLSEQDNNILSLKKLYQGAANAGAATIISRAGGTKEVPKFRIGRQNEGGPFDPVTGKVNRVPTGEVRPKRVKDPTTGKFVDTGEFVPKTVKVSKMEITDDAHLLTSKFTTKGELSGREAQPMERVYAEHANSMKALGNQARLDSAAVKVEKGTSKAAEAIYANEVKSLTAKLKVAQSNAPLERQAQALAGALFKARHADHPEWEPDDIKRARFMALAEARDRTGASKMRIGSPDNPLTDREWEAIQARAITPTKLNDILKSADMSRVKELATPKPRTSLTNGQQARINSLRSMGRSPSEIATALGIPRSTVVDHIHG